MNKVGTERNLSDQSENYFQNNPRHSVLQKVLWTKAIFTKQCRKMIYRVTAIRNRCALQSGQTSVTSVSMKTPRGMFRSVAPQLDVIMSNMKHTAQQGVQGQGKAIQRTALVSVKNRSKSRNNQSLAAHANYWQRVLHLHWLQATHARSYQLNTQEAFLDIKFLKHKCRFPITARNWFYSGWPVRLISG